MGGSSPSVFHTAPPQPASKARLTLYALSVGGAEASQKGLGDLMPRKVVVRSAMSLLPGREVVIDGMRGELAVLHRGDGEIFTAGYTVAAGPDSGKRSATFLVHADAVLFELEDLRGIAEFIPEHFLADGLEDHVRFESGEFARAF